MGRRSEPGGNRRAWGEERTGGHSASTEDFGVAALVALTSGHELARAQDWKRRLRVVKGLSGHKGDDAED